MTLPKGFEPGIWASKTDGRGPWAPLPSYAASRFNAIFRGKTGEPGQKGQSLAVVLAVLRNRLKDPQVVKRGGQVSIASVAYHAGLHRRQTGELLRLLIRAGWVIAEQQPIPQASKYRLHPAVEEEFARVTAAKGRDTRGHEATFAPFGESN